MSINSNLFYIVFIVSTVIGGLAVGVTVYFLSKKGMDLYKNHRLLKISLFAVILVVLPITWLTSEVHILWKILIPFIACAGVVSNYLFVVQGGNKFRDSIGYKKEKRKFLEKEDPPKPKK